LKPTMSASVSGAGRPAARLTTQNIGRRKLLRRLLGYEPRFKSSNALKWGWRTSRRGAFALITRISLTSIVSIWSSHALGQNGARFSYRSIEPAILADAISATSTDSGWVRMKSLWNDSATMSVV